MANVPAIFRAQAADQLHARLHDPAVEALAMQLQVKFDSDAKAKADADAKAKADAAAKAKADADAKTAAKEKALSGTWGDYIKYIDSVVPPLSSAQSSSNLGQYAYVSDDSGVIALTPIYAPSYISDGNGGFNAIQTYDSKGNPWSSGSSPRQFNSAGDAYRVPTENGQKYWRGAGAPHQYDYYKYDNASGKWVQQDPGEHYEQETYYWAGLNTPQYAQAAENTFNNTASAIDKARIADPGAVGQAAVRSDLVCLLYTSDAADE